MEDFDIIESGFSNADETINFGTRAIGYDTLYEISTIACLKCSEEVSGIKEVLINSFVKNGKYFLTLNRSIKVFEDTELSSITFNAVFDSIIDTICVSSNGNFLMVCLQSGMVHIFDLENTIDNRSIFNKCLVKNDLSNTKSSTLYIGCYIEDYTSKLVSFILVSNRGKVYRLCIISKTKSEDGIINTEAVVNWEEVYDFDNTIYMTCFSYPKLFVKTNEIILFDVENKTVMLDSLPCSIKTICNFGHKILVLDEDGRLYRICSLTLLIFPVEDVETNFENILVLDDAKNVQILAVTKKNEIGDSYLQLLESDFSVLFSLKVTHSLHLIQLENITDEILVLSKISNKEQLISELRIQCVYETQPQLRLTRLIRKQRFEEAEKFAKMFNINPVIVLKAKAQLIVDKVICSSEDITKLMQILESIDDDYFKLQCCSNVECSTYEDVRKILNYGCSIMPKSSCENKADILLLQRVLVDLLFRFDTYMAIYDHYDLQTWSKFSSTDLIEELQIFLKNFQIEKAIIIYNRLDLVTVDKLTDEKIEEILLILNNLSTTIYQPFLLTFIPITMTNKPSALPLFVSWLRNKIFHIEKRDNYNFPDNAIKFADSILKLLKVDKSGCILFQRQCTLNKDVLNDLSYLMECLRGLQLLKNKFGINISLSEYLMGPKTVIRTLLNIDMPPEDYNVFLNDFLYQFMIQNQFEPDDIFLNEITNLVKYNEECWVNIVEAILKHISSIKTKLEAIKEILENASVPWCSTVKSIGQSALQYTHPLVSDIKIILENEPRLVVLRNPKYKIQEKQINKIYELEHVVRRIIYVNTPTMLDDVQQLCKSQKERRQVNNILIQHFINNGNYEQALSILDSTGAKEDIYFCAKWIASLTENIINNELNLPIEYKKRYYKVAGSVFRRLIDNNDNKANNLTLEEDLNILRAVFKLNNMFQRNYTSYDLRSASGKTTIFEELVQEQVDNFNKGSLDIEAVLNICYKLANYFSLDADDVLITFCQKVTKYEAVLNVVERIYRSSTSIKNLCLAAVFLLKYMGSCDTGLSCDSFTDTSETSIHAHSNPDVLLNSENPNNMFINGLKLAEKVVVKALINADENELSQVLEVRNWINTGFYLTRSQENLQNELFNYLYHPEHTVPEYSSFFSIKNTFQMYCRFMGNNGEPTVHKYLTYCVNDVSPITEKELLDEISLLPETVESFCRGGQHLTAYKLLTTLEEGLMQAKNLDPSVYKHLRSIISKKCLHQVLNAVVSAKHIDILLFQNLLFASRKDYFKFIEYYLKLYKRQPRKLHDIAIVGIKLLDFHKISKGKDVLINAVTTCKWWNKLKLLLVDMPYDTFFKVNADTRLKELLSLSLLNLRMIQEYCDDYKLDLQMYYMEYLKSILTNWKPDYEVQKELSGKKILLIKNNESQLYTRCMEVITVIKDKDTAFSLMDKIWNTANFYHYEIFICILKILDSAGKTEKVNNLDLPMLLFLKNYRRFSMPSQNEKEQWYSAFPESQVLDPLSEFRLPFIQILFTYDIWNIIRPEINLKSYRYWFDAINILRKNLKKDDICIYAVKEVVTSGILGEEISGNWVLYPKYEDLFAEVDECVQNISDLERATSVVYHLMNHTPNGADKVNAAQLSYKYAQQYKDKYPNSADVDKAYVKVKTKYYSFSAMHILYTFQLADDKYIQLVAQPEDLIDALYQDGRIIKQAECVSLSCPDINKAVDTLGELFDLKVGQIKYNLLNRWLSSSNVDIDFDSTIVVKTNSDDSLKRAAYLCSSGNKQFWQNYLLKVGLNEEDAEDSEQKSFSFKAKALKCYCAISGVDTITQQTEVTYKEFLNYIDKLSLLSDLQCLGIELNVTTLDQYNKKDLLKRLSQVGKPIAIKVMAAICITYVIKDLRYWEYIINSAIKLGMYLELKTYVDFLKNQCYKSFYIKAWQVIIDNAFHVPNISSKEELHEIYVNNFLMLQSCPVLYSLNFEKIIQKCIQFDKHEFAAVLLQYLSEDKKDIYVKMISLNRKLFLDLDNLSKNGIWGIHKAKSWLATKM